MSDQDSNLEEDTVVPLFGQAGTCPICQAPTVKDYRPFCSGRCADQDLGNWFNESYAVPSSSPHGDDDD